MRRMFGIVVVLLILYIAFQVIYSYTVGKRNSFYKISVDGVEYQIKEVFTTRHTSANHNMQDKTNYYYEITNSNKLLFSFKIIGNYSGLERFLDTIKVYNGDTFTCAYPIFKDKTEDIDVMCNSNGKYYLYGAVKGQNVGLDGFVNSLKTLGYKHPSWESTNLETKKIGAFTIYPKNITDDQNLTIWQYNGFYRLTNRGEKFFALNTSDQYDPLLAVMVNQYYVVPEYKDKYKFSRLYVTNLVSGAMTIFDMGVAIPFDSFIQGVVDNKIYLIDRGNKIQYAIDIYNKEAKVTGDINNSTKYYNNGKWEQKSIYEAIDNNLHFSEFKTIPLSFTALNPISIDEVGGETDGYYYLYIKENNNVGVYRVDKQNTSFMTLLFRVSAANSNKYTENDIFFIQNDTLYTYRSNLGLRPLVKYSEFVFNKNNLYNVYINE